MTMTQIEGVPSRDSVKPGMAHFSGTGPGGSTCGECALLVLQSGSRELYRCAKFAQLTGKPGNCIKKSFYACKYFERKVKP